MKTTTRTSEASTKARNSRLNRKQRTTAPRKRPLIDPSRKTVLLVDDDKSVLEALRRVLRLEKWNVISTASGEEALEFLSMHRADLMITDLSMDAVSGWDLLFHENMQRPDLPIFVITALPHSHIGGADTYADEFFQKPLDIEALLVAAHKYIDGA